MSNDTPAAVAPPDAGPLPDELITFADARKLPKLRRARGGRGIWPSTFHQWHLRGLVSKDGMNVKLRAVRVGKTYHTCAAWLDEFFAALARQPGEAAPPKELKSHTAAAASLAAQGL